MAGPSNRIGHKGRGHNRGGRGGIFNALTNEAAPNSDQDTGEMNANLPERFKRSRPPRTESNNATEFDSALDFVVNQDIRKYVHAQEDIILAAEPGNWLSHLEIPTNEEVALSADAEVTLTANKIKGKWKSKDKYLRAHYELLREDAVSPLRDVVDKYKKDPDIMDDYTVSVYEKVYFLGFTFSQLGIAARIRFSTARAGRQIFWKSSKRLVSGTLVALFPADDKVQQNCIVALVAARPMAGLELSPPEIDLFFCRSEDLQIDPLQEWTMVEAKTGYYEAYRHTLRALQKLSKEVFPLSQHICSMSPDIDPPLYLSNDPVMNLKAATAPGPLQGYGHVDVLGDWPSAAQSGLDETQWDALHQILTKSFAIIQGPPGTGKTFISKVALEVLRSSLKEDEPPIIITAQTNHALDQLLGQVAKFEPRYIRLGGRSTDSEVKKRALFEIRRKERLPRLPGGLLGQAVSNWNLQSKKMIDLLKPLHANPQDPFSVETLLKYNVISDKQAKSLGVGASRWISSDGAESHPVRLWLDRALVPFRVQYEETPSFGTNEEDEDLEYEQLREHETETGVNDEEDWELLKGPWCCVEEQWTTHGQFESDVEKAAEELATTQDLWKVPDGLRGAMYQVMSQRLKEKVLSQFRKEAAIYDKNLKDLKIGKWERDAVFLRRAKIIGLTTTGLSKYRPLIASLKPKIILIEEAAEILEAPVTAACMESLEHLILVGDHLQLQGHCSVSELEGEPYYLNVSMFERLVRNGMPFKTLLRQRRMDPSFRKLISSLYPGLEDHHSVVNRQSADWGMGTVKSFFFTHEWSEYRDGQMSVYNAEEAKFVAAFYRYLVQNGVPTAEITVLTFYNGQRKKLLKELKTFPELKEAYNNVKTVDSYQGEENSIVLLSLTRSTHDGKIGFLEITNRVCVALSRAKLGFYIFGNGSTLLMSQMVLWTNVITLMKGSKRYANVLPLFCQKHNKCVTVQYVDDWDEIDGGCNEKCNLKMPCGHPCTLQCHPFPHDNVRCAMDCQKKLVCGHDCPQPCFEPCDCNCEVFKEAQWAAIKTEEPRSTHSRAGVEASAWDTSSMRRNLPVTDARAINDATSNGSVHGGGLRNGSAETANTEPHITDGWGAKVWNQGNGNSRNNGISQQTSIHSASYLPAQNPPASPSPRPVRQASSGRHALPHGKISHPAFQDQFEEATDSCMRWSPQEQAANRKGWENFAGGGVKHDDQRRERADGGMAKGAYAAAMEGREQTIEERTRDAGAGRKRFEGPHVPAGSWKTASQKEG